MWSWRTVLLDIRSVSGNFSKKKTQKDSIKRNSFCGFHMRGKILMNSQGNAVGGNHEKLKRVGTELLVRVVVNVGSP